MAETKGFLIDLDGVLYVGDATISGATSAIAYLKDHGYKFRCVSNTTRKSRNTIAHRLDSMGFDIPESFIFTPPIAAVTYMKNEKRLHYYLLATGDVDRDFPSEGRCNPPVRPDFVIAGDAGERITYDSLNTAFRFLMDGAELLALEKDRYWMDRNGLSLAAGPIVAALEYASGKRAAIMGKPSPAFFSLALQDMGLLPDQVAMIGDDIITDIGGAKGSGMTGILVRTGKYRKEIAESAAVTPDRVIDSIAQIQEIL